ncbi:hypothetical protein [Rhodococcoides fascians]|uniref:hypothetical protein n=1 Tax=Rhodococcoides fascians TaxID=1828 RepID=UPI000A97B8D3|nr:hypothetical protein [Rhodococcus fascians]
MSEFVFSSTGDGLDEPEFADEREEIAWLRAQLAMLRSGGAELGRKLNLLNGDVLDMTQLHHVIDADGDGDWMLVWERLAELVGKGHAAEGAHRIAAANTTADVRTVLNEFTPGPPAGQ